MGKSGDNFFFFLMATFIKEKQAVQENYTDKLKTERKPRKQANKRHHQRRKNKETETKKRHDNPTFNPATSFQFSKIWSTEMPWKIGFINTQLAMENLILLHRDS